jgi:hypothetical protein
MKQGEFGGLRGARGGHVVSLYPLIWRSLLLDQLSEEGADEAAKRYLTPNRVVAKGVQLRLLRQRVVMTAQKAQADVLLHRLRYALPGWDAAAERRDAQGEFHSAQRSPDKGQGRGWADGGDRSRNCGFLSGLKTLTLAAILTLLSLLLCVLLSTLSLSLS